MNKFEFKYLSILLLITAFIMAKFPESSWAYYFFAGLASARLIIHSIKNDKSHMHEALKMSLAALIGFIAASIKF